MEIKPQPLNQGRMYNVLKYSERFQLIKQPTEFPIHHLTLRQTILQFASFKWREIIKDI